MKEVFEAMDHVAGIDRDVLGDPKNAKDEAKGDPKVEFNNSKLSLRQMKKKKENGGSKKTKMFNQEIHNFLFNRFQNYRDLQKPSNLTKEDKAKLRKQQKDKK